MDSGELLGREDDLEALVGYVLGAENRVNLATAGRADGLSNVVFCLPPFLRLVEAFLSEDGLPAVEVTGEAGVGKSALLRALAARLEPLPGLRVFLHGGGTEVLLRRLHGVFGEATDEATDEELALMPLLAQGGRQGGLVLLLDGLHPGPWLPLPLPPGVRCVLVRPHVERRPPPRCRGLDAFPLDPLSKEAAAELRQRLGLIGGPEVLALARNPLWIRLAAPLPLPALCALMSGCGPPDFLSPLLETLVRQAEAELGEEAVSSLLSALACSRDGLEEAELEALAREHAAAAWAPLASLLGPALQVAGGRVRLSWHLAEVVNGRYLHSEPEQLDLWHGRLAAFFLATGAASRRCEAPYHFDQLDDAEGLLASLTNWDAFRVLAQERRSDLAAYCRVAGGYEVAREALIQGIDTSGPDGLERRLEVCAFLSHIGEFAAAKTSLEAARREASAAGGGFPLARACALLAENEVRFWDSRRNWESVGALQDLLESAQTAVEVLRTRSGRVREQGLYAQALTLRANGCFKAACVCPAEEADGYLAQADEAVEEVQQIFVGCPPSRILGRAILVGGVAKLVRAHNMRKAGEPYRQVMGRAGELFHKAQVILVRTLGEINESSVYTHGNLGELYMDIGQINPALYHHLQSCRVAVKLWGPAHPATESKLQELAFFFHTLRMPVAPQLLASGRGEQSLQFIEDLLRQIPPVPNDRYIRAWVEAEGRSRASSQSSAS